MSDSPPVQQLIDDVHGARYLARGITDMSRGTKYLASNVHNTRWLIEDVRSLTRQMINIISNDAHTQS